MKATQDLPAGYEELFSLDLSKNKAAVILLNLAGAFLFIGFGWLFVRASMVLRFDFWEAGGPLAFSIWEIVNFLIALALMLVLHEGVHGLLFWLFSRARPEFGFTGLYAYASAPEWHFPRNQYLVVGLGPLVLLSVLGLAIMPVIPFAGLPALLFFLTLNASGAVGDLYVIACVLTYSPNVYINDLGDSFTIYGPGAET